MTRLDAIKSRAKVVATKPENREATYGEFGAVLRLACFDVPALVAAVEAVLALHPERVSDNGTHYCGGCSDELIERYPCEDVEAIRTALGEEQ